MARAVLLGAAFVLVLTTCFSPARTSPATRKALRSVDCRRLVFHPYCRGVAAKRSMPAARPLEGLEGLEGRYSMEAAELETAAAPPRGFASLPTELRADPLLAGILDRLAAEAGREDSRREDSRREDSRREDSRREDSRREDSRRMAAADGQGDSSAGDSQASDGDVSWNSEQSAVKASDLGRYEWQSARKRVKEQEITYDY